jgi:hypothetical protein
MSAVDIILQLCETIAEKGETALRYRGVDYDRDPWYTEIEPYYSHLNTLIQYEPNLHETVLNHPRFLRMEQALHTIRSAYEQDNEMNTATIILKEDKDEIRDGWKEVRRIINEESYWAFSPEIEQALRGKKNVMIAGSGPLPSTGLSIAINLGMNVTCVNIDPETHSVSKKIMQLWAAEFITSHLQDVGTMDNLDQYDAIVATVQLGVDQHNRLDVIQHLINNLGSDSTLVVREPTGYGRLFYPCLGSDFYDLSGLVFSKVFPRTGPGQPYRSGLWSASKK